MEAVAEGIRSVAGSCQQFAVSSSNVCWGKTKQREMKPSRVEETLGQDHGSAESEAQVLCAGEVLTVAVREWTSPGLPIGENRQFEGKAALHFFSCCVNSGTG